MLRWLRQVQCPGTQRLAQRCARAQARTRAASGRCTWSCQTITRTSRHPSALSTGYTTRTWMKCVPALCHACACGACGLHGRGVLSRRCAHAGRGRYASTSSTRPGAPCSVRASGRSQLVACQAGTAPACGGHPAGAELQLELALPAYGRHPRPGECPGKVPSMCSSLGVSQHE